MSDYSCFFSKVCKLRQDGTAECESCSVFKCNSTYDVDGCFNTCPECEYRYLCEGEAKLGIV